MLQLNLPYPIESEPLNDSPYEATIFPVTSAGSVFPSIIVKATFDMPLGGVAGVSAGQIPPTGSDIEGGEPEKTAVRYESDFVPFKPQADVFCTGKAYAPEGMPVTETRGDVRDVHKIIIFLN